MKQEDFSQVQQLIALKRYEHPSDAYFEEFLDEFHRRQRQELLQRSSLSLFMERIGTWFSEGGKRQLVYGGGLAYAALALGFFFWPKAEVTPDVPTTTIEHVQTQDENADDMLKHDEQKAPIREAY